MIEDVVEKDQEFIITKNGKTVAVIVSADLYESWKETEEIRKDTEFMKEIKKGDLRWIWFKGNVIQVKVLSTYNHKNGICIKYETKTTCGSHWVDISQLFTDKEKCIKDHLDKVNIKHNKQLKNIMEKF